ncbi:hypothetical protein FE257_008163 [Aspergillus nanangensis]|uniref:Prolyl 4-hydroxylase alpha subunit domain-containing protein n=1 Tax=Aspergillus nanangensis TaxID=2582783 RepID=A0AAD4CNJ0_ASPNN|nr:hypothetical protein FE257_008163 [Aspergillus nanangensis]
MNIPQDFLCTPALPTATPTKIDFTRTNPPINAYKNHFAAIVDNLLTPAECNQLLQLAEQSAKSPTGGTPVHDLWDRALLNIGNGQHVKSVDTRNCGRIICDSPDLADRLLNRLLPFLTQCNITQISDQPLVTGSRSAPGVLGLTRLNERFRFLRYTGGEYFRPHCDGRYTTPDGREVSLFTVHLYLNGQGEQDNNDGNEGEENVGMDQHPPLRGGATSFRIESFAGEKVVKILPKTGSALVFQQRKLCHAGDDVLQGVKYTVRTDLMYEKVDS